MFCILYWFPIAPVANYHKFSGIRQHKLCYSFGGQDFKMGLTGFKKKKILAELCVSSEGCRRESIALPFLTSRGHRNAFSQWPLPSSKLAA